MHLIFDLDALQTHPEILIEGSKQVKYYIPDIVYASLKDVIKASSFLEFIGKVVAGGWLQKFPVPRDGSLSLGLVLSYHLPFADRAILSAAAACVSQHPQDSVYIVDFIVDSS